jgi:thioesterase domain-containing protein
VVDGYLAEIRAARPQGPYHLLGWSFGGLVAHALATRLQAEGDEVASLTLLDSYPQKDGGPEQDGGPAPEGDVLGPLLESLGADATDQSLLADLDAAGVRAVARVFARHVRLADTFVPAMFHGDATHVVATADKDDDGPDPAAWRKHLTGRLVLRHVDVTHGAMTQPEAMGRIGPLVAGQLERRSPRVQ